MKRAFLVAALLFAVPGAAPLFFSSGFLTTRAGGDSPFNLFRLHQLYTALQDGVFPVRWMPDAAFGLGYPFFNYYAALPYYFAAILKAYGFSYVLSLKLVVLAGFLIAAVGMYGWVKTITNRPAAALLAAAAYTFAPYHLVNIYVRGDSLSEFMAMAWYPLIFWMLYRAAHNPSRRNFAGVALAYGALVMTHNISALIFSPFVALYALILTVQLKSEYQGPKETTRMKESLSVETHGASLTSAPTPGVRTSLLNFISPRFKSLIFLAGAGILGLALAAWFWIPALTEQESVQLEDQTTGYFFYGNHFRENDLIQVTFAHDYNVIGAKANPFSMGLIQAIFIGAGIIGLIFNTTREKNYRRNGFLLFGLLFSTFMVTPYSEKLWEKLPLLELVQFPWRFLAIQAFFGAVVTGFFTGRESRRLSPPLQLSIPAMFRGAGRESRRLSPPLQLLIPAMFRGAGRESRRLSPPLQLFISILFSSVMGFAALSDLKGDFMQITDADVTAERLQWYEAFTGNIGTTIRAEYLPDAANPRPYTSDYLIQREPRVKFITGTGSGQQIEKNTNQQNWQIEVQSDTAQIALPLLDWPGWKVKADGEEIESNAVEGLGYIQFTLPEGQHEIELKLTRTPRRFFAEFISLAALLIILFLLIGRPRKINISGEQLEKAVAFLTPVILLAVVLRLLPNKNSDDSAIISADFAQASYFHPNNNGIPYENGMVLQSAAYQLDGTKFSYDSEWEITDSPVISRLDIASPLPVYFLGAPMYPVAVDSPENLHGEINLPSLTPGLYFPRILLFDEGSPTTQDTPRISPLTDDNVGRGDIYPAPVIVKPQTHVTENPEQSTVMGPVKILAATTRADEEYLHFTLWWEVLTEVPTNYGIDLQLVDVHGTEWARLNALAGGAGIYPSALWQPGEIIPDNYRVDLPYGIPTGEYTLRLNLYHPVSLESLYQAEIPGVAQNYVSEYTCPLPQNSPYYDGLRVNELNFNKSVYQGDTLAINMVWSAATPPQENYQMEWTLGDRKFQTPLAPASDATTWQTNSECGAYVVARHRLEIPGTLPAGTYPLTMRLLSENGNPLVDAYEAGTVEVIGWERLFEVPDLQTDYEVTFENRLKLWGYNIQQAANSLNLELIWGAQTDPDADYKFFVHLYDADKNIVSQIDTVPRNNTSRWIEGEVVLESVTFDLSSIPPGIYMIGVGWYNAQTGERLSARRESEMLPDNIAILPDTVTR